MNFFKSILSDESDPPKPDDSDPNSPEKPNDQNDVAQDDTSPVWNFGGLIKTLATRSESVIETYRRDLQEFGSGLRKESEILREAASRAVKDLPASLEAGAGALDGVIKSTAEIISREALVFGSDGEAEIPETNRSANSGRYSWFDSQLGAIQSDVNTFIEEPEDGEEYRKWKSGFEVEEYRKSGEIEGLVGEGGVLEGVYRRVVPNEVDEGTFWCRYFYRVEKLKQQERVRADLVKRAIKVDDEEELSWDVDDDEEMEERESVKGKGVGGDGDEGVRDESLKAVGRGEGEKDEKEGGNGDKKSSVEEDGKKKVEESSKKNEDKNDVEALSGKEAKPQEVAEVENEEKVKSGETVLEKKEEKGGVEKEKSEADKKTDESVVPVQESKVEEEDLGWDEIEDVGSGDEKKVSSTTHGGSPNRDELRKRLSVADDDDEDLSWDIEDDDEPVKA